MLPVRPVGPVQVSGPRPILLAITAKATPAVQAAAQARINVLEAAIEADPHDIVAWDARLREALQEGKPAATFERAVKQFPLSARIWTAYAEWNEVNDHAEALPVYERCLAQIPSLDLWSSYLTFCKRHCSLEDICTAYRRSVNLLGTDWRAGLLWAEYIALLKHAYNCQQKKENPEAEVSGRLLAEDPNPVEATKRAMKQLLRKIPESSSAVDLSDEEFIRVGEALKIDVSALREAFQRATCTAHSALDKIWMGYEQFEKSLGNPQMAQKLLGEHMPRYVRGKTAFKELQALCTGMDHFAVATPPRTKNAAQQAKLMEKWRAVLHYEHANPLRLGRKELQARVSLIYQQAALSLAFHAEIWHDFAAWLDLGGQHEQASDCLRRAIDRFLPRDLTLRLVLAHRHEVSEAQPSAAALQGADDEYKKLLDDMPKPSPLALINYLAYVRRQYGMEGFREAFLEAAETSAHCTWEVYAFAALTEYHSFGSLEAAARTFRLGLERYAEREPSLLAAYVNFLIGANDLRSARAELSRGVLDRLQAGVRDRLANRSDPLVKDSLAFLWQKWARLERYFGDACAVRRAAAFRDEEYRNLQRDEDVEEEAIAETPLTLGLGTTIEEVEEGYRFLHLVPEASRVWRPPDGVAATAPRKAPAVTPAPASPPVQPAPTATAGGAASAASTAPAPATVGPLVDQAVADASDEHRRLLGSTPAAGLAVHIARPDVSKMLSFRPALDVVGRKRPKGEGTGPATDVEDQVAMPIMIPKCLQDLLAVLPARPLKGAKPDVDYLLTVLQTVSIPPIPVKDLEHFRYDSLRLLKEEDGDVARRLAKDELEENGNGFFSSKSTLYRERLKAKRQKIVEERQAKPDGAR